MTSQPNSSRVDEIVRELVSEDKESSDARDVTLQELSEIYHSLSKQRGADPLLKVVSLQNRLMAQFPEVSYRLLYVNLAKDQRPRDSLSFVLRLDWAGPEEPRLTWKSFMLGEFRSTRWLLLILVVGLTAGFGWLHDASLMADVNQLVLTSLSIFVSIFVVFVIGESKRLTGRSDLFQSGRLHEFWTSIE
jgi:hypothetical protein